MTDPASAGPHTAKQLPQRIQKILIDREQESERLIGWVQLALAGMLLTLYLIAPRPADAPMTMGVEPVPVALAAYAAFTLLRLLMSYLTRLPGWLVILSILADTILMIGLIWWFHREYQQPAAFYLKVPTLTYLFVLIALRALRFDWRYVLAAGFAAALGWSGLVFYALDTAPTGTVTRSFVEYLTSNRILIGAEFDKIFSILMLTGILTLAVYRARVTLVTAVRDETANRDMRRFLSADVADTITGAERDLRAGEAQERNAAIIMLDIRGFTAFSRTVAPEEVVAALTQLHARVVPIAQAHGGSVDKFLGDGIMFTFGVVQPSDTPCADAVRALTEILAATEAFAVPIVGQTAPVPLAVNGAVASGPVVFATIGVDDRLEYTVIGSAANLAAKLEDHNKRATSRGLIEEQTLLTAREQGLNERPRGRKLEAQRLPGIDRDLTVYTID